MNEKATPRKGVTQKLLQIGIALGLMTSGCAATQTIKIHSTPPGAVVYLENAQIGKTPFEARLNPKKGPAMLRIEKEGYEPREVLLRRDFREFEVAKTVLLSAGIAATNLMKHGNTKAGAIGASAGFVTAAGGGLTYGFAGGSYYKLEPEMVFVKLQPID